MIDPDPLLRCLRTYLAPLQDEVEKMKVADREKVLSAIVTNMASPLLPVRTTATRALLTALDFAE